MTIQRERIRGVILDVDGTLYYQLPLRVVMACYLLLANLFKPLYLMRILRVIKIYRRQQEFLRISFSGVPSLPEQQMLMTADATGEPVDFVTRVTNEWMSRRPLPLLKFFIRPGVKCFLGNIIARGMRVGIYSDYPCREKLDCLRIKDKFHAIVSSFDPDVLQFKPDAKGFLACSQKLGLEPSEVLYIGDRIEVDGKGALSAGMQVVLVGGISRKTNSGEITRYRSFTLINEEIFL